MAEQVCNLLEGSSMVHHVRGNGMTKRVCRASNNTCTLEEILADRLDMKASCLNRKRCAAGVEHPYWHAAKCSQIDGERLAHILRQWEYPLTSVLLTAYPDGTNLPINIL